MLTLGYKASAEQFGPRDLLAYAIHAERAGFDSVFVSDHFQPWRHTNGHAPNALAWLGALAARTQKVTIGTSVLTPSFRYHPAIVAQALATTALLAEGRRVVLGVGTGESLNEVALGIEWPDQKERFARLKEATELIRELWSRDFVTFDGQFFKTDNATIYDKPETPVELWIAASGPAAARLAGRVADGFICTSGKGMELYTETLLPAVAEGAEKAGRSTDAVEKMIEMKVSYDDNRQRALADCGIWAALALSGEKKMGVDDPREMERLASELSIEQAATRWLVSDDADEHVEQLRPYIEAGFSHLVFHGPGNNQTRFINAYARDILPRLRERWG
ncbi:MAG TPA: glucose-6-phosphate dehydrogenase (coenzyme-F420) [Candidatus Limnocylindrales bacterium]|nr:glucose-6-phosphate dehydrogenase (coenzyme-F420) [Candidatus Limnocylindrales bacterium]HEU4919661.1 glucose-6-phosphate dehydrogenase (coenzyme-F420) [Candidatus Limnocylindrales bacterium]